MQRITVALSLVFASVAPAATLSITSFRGVFDRFGTSSIGFSDMSGSGDRVVLNLGFTTTSLHAWNTSSNSFAGGSPSTPLSLFGALDASGQVYLTANLGSGPTFLEWNPPTAPVSISAAPFNFGSIVQVSADGSLLAASGSGNIRVTNFTTSQILPTGTFPFLGDMSDSGSVIVGTSLDSGNSNRAEFWTRVGSSLTYTRTDIGATTGNLMSGSPILGGIAEGVSPDGSKVVGYFSRSAIVDSTEAFLWNSTTSTLFGLGLLPGTNASYATDVTDQGVVVGYADTDPNPSRVAPLSFVWTQALGMKSLPDYLLARYGIGFSGYLSTYSSIEAISDDGRLFLVSDYDPSGRARLSAIRVVVPEISATGLLASALPIAGLYWVFSTSRLRRYA